MKKIVAICVTYTLALRFQAQTGRILSGQQVKQLLAEPVNHSIHAAKS